MDYIILAVIFFSMGFLVSKANTTESSVERMKKEIYVPNYHEIMNVVPATHAHAAVDYVKSFIQCLFTQKFYGVRNEA